MRANPLKIAHGPYIDERSCSCGEEVQVWLYNLRGSSKIHLLLRDVAVFAVALQQVWPMRLPLPIHPRQETSLEVTGAVREEQRAPGGFSSRTTFKHFKV